ncbi:hypothetical protein BC831DRAFT_480601 [Entophlyctis helioformis]|nr:hypothetical protein BC831DRAFT_480601 [Entophlyctis helioformis]
MSRCQTCNTCFLNSHNAMHRFVLPKTKAKAASNVADSSAVSAAFDKAFESAFDADRAGHRQQHSLAAGAPDARAATQGGSQDQPQQQSKTPINLKRLFTPASSTSPLSKFAKTLRPTQASQAQLQQQQAAKEVSPRSARAGRSTAAFKSPSRPSQRFGSLHHMTQAATTMMDETETASGGWVGGGVGHGSTGSGSLSDRFRTQLAASYVRGRAVCPPVWTICDIETSVHVDEDELVVVLLCKPTADAHSGVSPSKGTDQPKRIGIRTSASLKDRLRAGDQLHIFHPVLEFELPAAASWTRSSAESDAATALPVISVLSRQARESIQASAAADLPPARRIILCRHFDHMPSEA